jgi:hypothetical protein
LKTGSQASLIFHSSKIRSLSKRKKELTQHAQTIDVEEGKIDNPSRSRGDKAIYRSAHFTRKEFMELKQYLITYAAGNRYLWWRKLMQNGYQQGNSGTASKVLVHMLNRTDSLTLASRDTA